jgi:hypothetical protein
MCSTVHFIFLALALTSCRGLVLTLIENVAVAGRPCSVLSLLTFIPNLVIFLDYFSSLVRTLSSNECLDGLVKL